MSLKPIADKAVVQICNTIAAQLSDDEKASISRIVEQVVIDTTASTSKECAGIVKFHSGPEADIAHKIAEELKLAETALIANLMGMR